MFRKLLTTSCLLVLGFSLSSCSSMHKMFHGDKHKHANEMFEMMDANKDGRISKTEFRKFGDDKFKAMDTNKDGQICQKEFLEHKKHYKNHK